MDSERQPAQEGLAALSHHELMALEEQYATAFDALYEQARAAVTARGKVSATLAAQVEEAQLRHAAVVQALQLDLWEHEANIGTPPVPTDEEEPDGR